MNVSEDFYKIFGTPPAIFARAPGRVNLLGEHVDYNGGPVLPIALDREVQLAAVRSSNMEISLTALDLDKACSFTLESLQSKKDTNGDPLPTWALYPAGVAWSLNKNGKLVTGIKACYCSNIPIGAGLSSSAAVEVTFGVLWEALGGWKVDALKLALYCQEAENHYVGVATGLMDQFASACGVEDHALFFDTLSLEWHTEPLPRECIVIVADSRVARSLTSSGYNERRQTCESAINYLQKYKPGIQYLRDIDPVEFAAYKEFLPELERKRAEHVVKEISRVFSGVKALHRGEKQSFGALMYASHASLRDLYEVSHPNLDILVEAARQIPGCIGARLTGAGFGGCTVNLVEEALAQDFILELKNRYLQASGIDANVYVCRASQGASVSRVDNA